MLRYILVILLIPLSLSADSAEIGEIVQSSGKVDIYISRCSSEACIRKGTKIYPGDSVRSLSSSKARILLNDGTGIEITGPSSFIVENTRNSEKSPPSLIRAHYGTFAIIQNNRFTDTSLIIETETAVIKSVTASLYIIAATDETAVMVYSSIAGAAGRNPQIRKAYILSEGEETFIPKNQAPRTPERVDALLRGSWLTKNHLSKDLSRIIRRSHDSSVIDWIFRNRD